MSTLRIASFNVENLFRRAKLLNLEDRAETTRLLGLVDQLQAVLKKSSYTAADKAKIVQLSADLKGYAGVREDRGKLFSGQGTSKVAASGKGDWDGEITFNQEKVADGARKSTAAVMKAVKADVCCVVEAESRPVLKSFNSEMLTGATRFDYPFLIDGNDQRGIDVGVLSKLPIGPVHTHMFEKSGSTALFSRDCLHVELLLPDGRTLHLLCNHLKSKMNNDAASDTRRKLQADRIAEILTEKFDLRNDLVVVAGDMNDTPTSATLQKLLGKANLYDALKLQFGNDMQQRWTYKYRNQLDQIDYLLISRPLKDAFVQAGVERRGIHGVEDITGVKPFPSVTSYSNHASDHAAVWVDVEL
ncbi:MAG: endonuclease/exonuclease/phosphatase family protein [Flavobacteriales bacterium]|nr:endonuclease/exonuclease/phosphatase family protein [Flavobacteriales bacterium]